MTSRKSLGSQGYINSYDLYTDMFNIKDRSHQYDLTMTTGK